MNEQLLMTLVARAKIIALVGASPKQHRASYRVMAYLIGCGIEVIPVNPSCAGSNILGCEVVAKLQDIGKRVDGVNVFRRSEFIAEVYEDLRNMARPPKWLWLQQDIIDYQTADTAQQAGIAVIMDRCLMIEHQRFIQ